MKYLREIMIVSMILFLIFLIDINENVDNDNSATGAGDAGANAGDASANAGDAGANAGDAGANAGDASANAGDAGAAGAATTTNETSEIKRNKTVLDHNIESDAIKNLNNFFPDNNNNIKGLIYPEFPVDIINFKILPEDLEDTRIETDNVQKKIKAIINPKTTLTDPIVVDSLKNTWVKSGEETSNAVLSITKNGKKIQDGVDLKYVSGCTEIVNGDTSGTGSCFDNGDINTCHETNNCVWDIICEQPHRNDFEKDKIYTPQECIDRGGIVRTDILHAIKNKIKTSDSGNTDIYSVFDKKEGKSMFDYYTNLGTFNHGKNPSDACSLFPQDENDGVNKAFLFDPNCQNYLGTLIDLNIFSDFFSTNNDNYITKIDNGIMKKDNRYDTPSDLSEWGISQKSCLWSSRLSFEDYTKCSKENIYKKQDIDWNYYKDMNNKEYTYSDTTIDFNDDLFSIFDNIKTNLYSIFKKFNTSDENTHIWENNMNCETWVDNNLECSLETEKKNTIINNFNKVDYICCAPEYSINLNEINESIKNILHKLSDDWTPTNDIYTSPEINASICKVYYELITDDIDNIIKLDDLKTDKDIFTLNINLHDFNMEKMEYDTHLDDNSVINNITTTLNCGNSYNSQVELKYIFILKSENNSLSLTIESRKDSLTISTKKYIIAGLPPDTPAPDNLVSDKKLTIDINTLLDEIASNMINTSELSFEFILKNILLLKTKDINDSLFTPKDNSNTSLKISIVVPVFGHKNIDSRDISKKLCDMDTNIDGYYDISIPLGSSEIISGFAESNPFYDYNNDKITVKKIFEQCEDNLPHDFDGKKLLNRLYSLFKIIDNYNNKKLPKTPISCNLSEEFDKSNKGEFIELFKENISSIPPLLEAILFNEKNDTIFNTIVLNIDS